MPSTTGILDRIAPVNPLTGSRKIHFFPERLEIALGGYNYINYIDRDGGPWENPHLNKIVQDCLKEMMPHTGRSNLPWKITMVDTSVVNAWAKMGGFMGINRGLVDRMANDERDFDLGYISTEDKIRSVIAHEMAHVSLRHSARFAEIMLLWTLLAVWSNPFWDKMEDCWEILEDYIPLIVVQTLLSSFLTARYTRGQELEADKYGMHLMWRCGYDPKAMIWAEHFLKDYEPAYGIAILDLWDRLFWSHPTTEERVEAEKVVLAELEAKGSFVPELAI